MAPKRLLAGGVENGLLKESVRRAAPLSPPQAAHRGRMFGATELPGGAAAVIVSIVAAARGAVWAERPVI